MPAKRSQYQCLGSWLGLVAGFVYGRDQAGQRDRALMFHSRATGAEVDLNLTHPGDLFERFVHVSHAVVARHA